jgi:hypothetical protein
MGNVLRQSERHAQAFEFWVALGADRTYAEVARRFQVSVQSIGTWARAFQWEKRLSEREKTVQSLLAQKAIEDEVKSRSDALKIVHAIKVRFAEQLQANTAALGAGDFEKAVKLELLLRGKATERTELIAGPVFDRLIDLLIAVVEREVADPDTRARLAAGFQEAAAGIGVEPPGGHA